MRRKPMRIDGRPVSGKVFCRELDKVFRNGEKVMAYIGSSHAAAILPVTENGATHYKIIDSWDSSGRTVGEYWVKIPERETVDAPKETRRVFGTYVTHPVFGRGKIRNIDPSGWMLVDFPQSGSRYLDCRWVLRNCKTEESASA